MAYMEKLKFYKFTGVGPLFFFVFLWSIWENKNNLKILNLTRFLNERNITINCFFLHCLKGVYHVCWR